MLGRKQTLVNDDWINMFNNIEKTVSRSHIDALTYRTVKEIQKTTFSRKAAFGWSGGKDSLVLHDLCKAAGINNCMMSITKLEYPAFVEWIKLNKPEKLEFIHTGQDLQWLSEHQDFLFPADSKAAGRWFPIVQWRGQKIFYEKNNLDIMIFGRRKIEGNFVGRGSSNQYTNKSGITIYNPMADWRHEEVYGFIFYNNITLPPIYFIKNGFRRGTHPWPLRKWTGSIENGWYEVHQIDETIVIEAAHYISSAREFMEGLR